MIQSVVTKVVTKVNNIATLTYAEKVQLLQVLEDKEYLTRGTKFYRWFNDREGYYKHLEFLKDGKTFRQRAFLAGNRVGKSETGAFEAVCHLTGIYPQWWEGKRFDKPTNGWVVGKTSATVMETTQVALLGPPGEWGTGMIPRDLLITNQSEAATPRAHVVQVRHISGGVSSFVFKTNDSGRQSFEGTAKDFIWGDEEMDQSVYHECLLRTMTTGGIIYTTFTPLRGLTPLINSLLKDGNLETPQDGISVTMCSWSDAPHLDEATQKEMLAALPPYQRMARSAGIPMLGAGVIYPIDPAEYTIAPFEIPKHYLRLGALDVGWRRTAALWGAIDPETGIAYIYSEHYRGEAEPTIHAEALKSRNKEGVIPLVIDTAAHGRSQIDGQNLFNMYSEFGLGLINANKAVETGIYETWTRFSAGRIKIFNNCSNLLSELRTYRRNEKGQIHKENDHLADCLRYFVMGIDGAVSLTPPKAIDPYHFSQVSPQYRSGL